MTRSPDTPAKAGSLRVLVAAAALSGMTALVINLQPILMGALAMGRGVSDAGIGQISAVFIGSSSLSLCTAPWWVGRWDWRVSSSAGILIAVLICLLGALATSYPAIILVFSGLGLATGIAGAVAFASLGDIPHTDRAFGASVIAQAIVPAVVAFPLAGWIIPKFGPSGMFIALAVVSGCAWAACAGIPPKAQRATRKMGAPDAPPIFSADALPAAIALIGKTLFGAGILGFWYFMERMGTARGVSLETIGILVSVCSLSSILTAGLIAWLDDRFSTLGYVSAGSLLLLIAYALMQIPSQEAYVVSTQLFAMGWGLAQPAYFALIRKVDGTGRLFVAAPATVGLAGVLIGLAAGPVIGAFGYPGLMLVSAGLIIAAGFFATGAFRLASVRGRGSVTAGPLGLISEPNN